LRQPGRPLWRIAAWQFLQMVSWYLLWLVYRSRSWGANNIPAQGPVLFLSNHQSFLDPILLGYGASKRHFFSLGRSTLYDTKLKALMGNLTNSIPVEQGAGDVAAMKKCIAVLKDNQALMMFPEGGRTLDHAVHKFETGAMLIIKRAKPTVVPVAVEGPFQAWPPQRKRPRLWGQRLGVMYGEPIAAHELLAMKPAEAMEMLRQRVDGMRRDVAKKLDLDPDS
ncbi:MAG: lysophospholipid acyltransferase family protein, partial [Algisphaera sp.]